MEFNSKLVVYSQYSAAQYSAAQSISHTLTLFLILYFCLRLVRPDFPFFFTITVVAAAAAAATYACTIDVFLPSIVSPEDPLPCNSPLVKTGTSRRSAALRVVLETSG